MAEAFLESIGTAELLPQEYQRGYNAGYTAGRNSMSGEYNRGYNAGYTAGKNSVQAGAIVKKYINPFYCEGDAINADDTVGSALTITGPNRSANVILLGYYSDTSIGQSIGWTEITFSSVSSEQKTNYTGTFRRVDLHVSRSASTWKIWATANSGWGNFTKNGYTNLYVIIQ